MRLASKEERDSALRAARCLKESEEFARVYVKPDLTEAERFGHSQLRETMKRANAEEERKGTSLRYRVAGHRLVSFKIPSQEAKGRPVQEQMEVQSNLVDLGV